MINLEAIFDKYGFGIDSVQINYFKNFLNLFLETNSKINLSAIRDEAGVVEKHFIDSIMIEKFFNLRGKILDIGSGGGFSGIPLKIIRSDLEITLLDSIGKKVDCMNYFIENLGLNGIKAIKNRAEDLAKDESFYGSFDYVLSRATAYMPQIIEWSKPFLNSSGKIILYKLYNEEEIKDGEKIMKKLGMKILRIENYKILDQQRIFILIGK